MSAPATLQQPARSPRTRRQKQPAGTPITARDRFEITDAGREALREGSRLSLHTNETERILAFLVAVRGHQDAATRLRLTEQQLDEARTVLSSVREPVVGPSRCPCCEQTLRPKYLAGTVAFLEREIDRMEGEIPALQAMLVEFTEQLNEAGADFVDAPMPSEVEIAIPYPGPEDDDDSDSLPF